MWKIIDENKKKSKGVAFLMLIVFILTGVFYGIFISSIVFLFKISFAENPAAITLEQYISFSIMCSAICTAGIILLWYLKTRNKEGGILKSLDALEISGKFKYIDDIAEEMVIASGLGKKPSLYIIESSVPNAFAIGYEQEKSSIVLTSRLVELLDRNELQGVIAHEISHIKNLDCRLMTSAYVMLYFIFLFSGRLLHFGRSSSKDSSTPRVRSRGGSSGGGGGGGGAALGPLIPVIIVALIIATIYIFIIAPIFIRILYSMLSKKREYLADACAVQYTRYPSGLADALTKLESTNIYGGNKSMKLFNSLAIIPSFSDKIETHPPTELRIKILNKMAGSGLADYNAQYNKVIGKNLTKYSYDFKSQEIVKKPDMAVAAGVVAAAAIAGTIVATEEMSKLEKHRAVGNILEQSANYVEIQCDCETKLKIPPEYIGQKLNCPHCGKEYEIKGETK